MPTNYRARDTQRCNNSDVTGTWTGLTSETAAGSTVNNRGVIRRGGNIASSRWTATAIAENVIVTGPIVYNSSGNGLRKIVDKAVSAGNFARMTAGSYVARRLTTTLAGVANTTLLSGASDFQSRRSIHKLETWRTSFLVSASWSRGSVLLETPGSNLPTYTFVYSNDTTSFGQNSAFTSPASLGTQDSAANPSATYPGTLVYKTNRPTPVLDLYKAKTQS